MIWFLSLTVATAAAAAIAVRFNALRFGARVGEEIRGVGLGAPFSGESLRDDSQVALPEPIARYLAKAVAPGRRGIATVQIEHGGTFRPKLDGGWLAIRGRHCARAEPPAFVWWGRVRLGPGLWIDARDRFEGGHGNMLVMMESTLTLADRRGPAIDQGALLRWLAELVWLPTAFRNPRITWTASGPRRAEARLRVDPRDVTGTFEFGADDLPAAFRALRYRDLGNGDAALTEFLGTRVTTGSSTACSCRTS